MTGRSAPEGLRAPLCWSPDGGEILFSSPLTPDDRRKDLGPGEPGLGIWAIRPDGPISHEGVVCRLEIWPALMFIDAAWRTAILPESCPFLWIHGPRPSVNRPTGEGRSTRSMRTRIRLGRPGP